MKISEVATTQLPDGQKSPPHLRTWQDGWRHLRFLLMYSPRWLFLYPGFAMILAGLAGCAWLLPGPQFIGGIGFDVHTLLYAFVPVLLGFQLVAFAVFSKIFAISEGLLPKDQLSIASFVHQAESGSACRLPIDRSRAWWSVYAVSDCVERGWSPKVRICCAS